MIFEQKGYAQSGLIIAPPIRADSVRLLKTTVIYLKNRQFVLTCFSGTVMREKHIKEFSITNFGKVDSIRAESALTSDTTNKKDVILNIITLDFCDNLSEDEDGDEEDGKLINTEKVIGAIFPAQVAIEIQQQGNLDISKNCKLNVLIYSRTREEFLPILMKHSLVAESKNIKVGFAKVQTQMAIDDLDKITVPSEQDIKAFNYGKQIVRRTLGIEYVDDKDIKLQSSYCEKQFKLLGFTDDQSSLSSFLSRCLLRGSFNERAFAVLVYAVIETHRILITRIIERKNYYLKLVLYSHNQQEEANTVYGQLPTNEEKRDYKFLSLYPASRNHMQAAMELIKALDFHKKKTQMSQKLMNRQALFDIRPCSQVLQSNRRAQNDSPEEQVLQDLNKAIAEYVNTDKELFTHAQEEASAFEEAFKPEHNNEKENKKQEEAIIAMMKLIQNGGGFEFKDNDGAVKEIGSVNPIEDFKKMVTDRKVDRVGTAIDQMKDMITKLVNNSLNGDLYHKAIECLASLREACITEDEAQEFNLFMEQREHGLLITHLMNIQIKYCLQGLIEIQLDLKFNVQPTQMDFEQKVKNKTFDILSDIAQKLLEIDMQQKQLQRDKDIFEQEKKDFYLQMQLKIDEDSQKVQDNLNKGGNQEQEDQQEQYLEQYQEIDQVQQFQQEQQLESQQEFDQVQGFEQEQQFQYQQQFDQEQEFDYGFQGQDYSGQSINFQMQSEFNQNNNQSIDKIELSNFESHCDSCSDNCEFGKLNINHLNIKTLMFILKKSFTLFFENCVPSTSKNGQKKFIYKGLGPLPLAKTLWYSFPRDLQKIFKNNFDKLFEYEVDIDLNEFPQQTQRKDVEMTEEINRNEKDYQKLQSPWHGRLRKKH
eukprot:403351317